MPDSKLFSVPFANSGDKVTIPEAAQSSGVVSMAQGFGPDYERDPENDPLAKRVPRDETNELYYQITNAIRVLQLLGYPEWYAQDAQGNAVSYSIAARVRHNNQVWASTAAANTTTPGASGATWALVEPFSFAALEATVAEAQAQSIGGKLITPRRLGAVTATEDRRGLAELASVAEALGRADAERIITPATLDAVLNAASLGVPANSVFFRTPGAVSWTCPPNITRAFFRVWGGGGGSGGAYNGGNSGGGGGAGYTEQIVNVTPGQVYNGVVGAGGNPGNATTSPTAGGTGGTSSIAGLSATGGSGGGASAGAGQLGGSAGGGNGSGGTLNIEGGASSAGALTVGAGGGLGGASYGAPGVPPGGYGQTGYRGPVPGGGAGGTGAPQTGANYAGGRGGNGLIVIQW